ncbi:UNKNOWN [Stylonychia lemnae]|uniref:Uncharacterized protein n=1 Tax=Stylonychia lemnae TaxID=5949 RepID=A0A078AC64_STYLE|nr:UNKNOWN [Stylonychia lemnae]|eukprot:CDW79426.1 UNKNOWN [Stylonychia lemnae]
MLNKPVKKDSDIRHNYDEDTYLKALKKFTKESRGLTPGTQEHTNIRNKIYAELREQKAKEAQQIKQSKEMFKQHQQDMVVAEFSSFYCLLIVVPESIECYETAHILRYYDFPINIEEDNILKQEVKKEMGFRKDDQYPLLLIDSSSNEMPSCELTTQYQITSFLEFLDQNVTPLIEDIYKDFRPLMQFYLHPKHFKKANIVQEPGIFLRSYLSKMSKREKYAKLQKQLDVFVERLQGNLYHGVDRPDAVDFRHSHTFTLKNIFFARGKQDKLQLWFKNMDKVCQNRTTI